MEHYMAHNMETVPVDFQQRYRESRMGHQILAVIPACTAPGYDRARAPDCTRTRFRPLPSPRQLCHQTRAAAMHHGTTRESRCNASPAHKSRHATSPVCRTRNAITTPSSPHRAQFGIAPCGGYDKNATPRRPAGIPRHRDTPPLVSNNATSSVGTIAMLSPYRENDGPSYIFTLLFNVHL